MYTLCNLCRVLMPATLCLLLWTSNSGHIEGKGKVTPTTQLQSSLRKGNLIVNTGWLKIHHSLHGAVDECLVCGNLVMETKF